MPLIFLVAQAESDEVDVDAVKLIHKVNRDNMADRIVLAAGEAAVSILVQGSSIQMQVRNVRMKEAKAEMRRRKLEDRANDGEHVFMCFLLWFIREVLGFAL